MKERRKRRSTKDIEESIINAATRFIETEGFSNLTVTSIRHCPKFCVNGNRIQL